MQHRDRKRSRDLMFMRGLKETIDQLAMANSVRWDGHVLRREDGHVLRREDGHVLRKILDFEVEGQRKRLKKEEEVEGQRKKLRPRGCGKRRLRKKV